MRKLLVNVFVLFVLSCFQGIGQTDEQTVDNLIKELGIRESEEPIRKMKAWSRPEKISFRLNGRAEKGVGSKEWLLEVAVGVEIEFVSSESEIEKSLIDSDVYFGGCTKLIMKGKNLDYIHITSAGIDRCGQIPGIKTSKLIATNNAKVHSVTIAEHSIAMMMALTRRISMFQNLKANSNWNRGNNPDAPKPIAVKGKTMLVLGLGVIGSQVASRGNKLEMRVIGTRNSSRTGPDYVDYVGLSNETIELAKLADVVVNALPLTEKTEEIIGNEFFNNLKDGS